MSVSMVCSLFRRRFVSRWGGFFAAWVGIVAMSGCAIVVEPGEFGRLIAPSLASITVYGSQGIDILTSSTRDAKGAIYATGYFSGTTAFGDMTRTSQSDRNGLIAKLDANGKFVWVSTFGGEQESYGTDIQLSPQGNLYVAGFFQGKIAIGEATLEARGSNDTFVAKFDGTGALLWVRQVGGTGKGLNVIYKLAVDAEENVYASGLFSQEPRFGQTNLPTQSGGNAHILEISARGELKRTILLHCSDGHVVSRSIALDGEGQLYIAGFGKGTCNFGGQTRTLPGTQSGFLARFASSGTGDWVSLLEGENVVVMSMRRAENGDVAVGAQFRGGVTIGKDVFRSKGGLDGLVARFQADGKAIWAISYGGSRNDLTSDLAFSSTGELYISGTFDEETQFGSFRFKNQAEGTIYLAKVSTQGKFTWVNSFAGSGAGGGGGLQINGDNELVMVGGYHDHTDFAGHVVSSNGKYDGYIARFYLPQE